MSSIALNKMHATLNKHHEVSPDPSSKPHQHMYNIKTIKCPIRTRIIVIYYTTIILEDT